MDGAKPVKVYEDGTYYGEDGHIHAADGGVLFQEDIVPNVVDLTDVFSKVQGMSPAETAQQVEDHLKALIGKVMDTATAPLQVQVTKENKAHVVRSNTKLKGRQEEQHSTALLMLEKIINNAVKNNNKDGIVDLTHNTRKQTLEHKRKVEQYVYFDSPVRINNQDYIVSLTTEQVKGQDPNLLDLYNVHVKRGMLPGKRTFADHPSLNTSITRSEADVNPRNGNILYQGQIAENSHYIELTINSLEEMQGLSDEDFKNKMLNTLKSFKGNKIFNRSLNSDIEIRTSSIKKYKRFFADKNKRLIVPYIPELLRKARFTSEGSYTKESEPNIRAYYKADLPIHIDENNYNVHLTVREDQYGNFFWDAQIKEEPQHATPATNPSVGGLTSELSEDGLGITQTSDLVNRGNDNILEQSAKSIKRASYNQDSRVIQLLKDATAASLPHEFAHYWLDNITGYVNSGQASEAYLQNFYKPITDWLGKPKWSNGFSRAQHEKFASGYEKYLREGHLPKPILGAVFDDYDKWLKEVYESAEAITISGTMGKKPVLTPEIIKDFKEHTLFTKQQWLHLMISEAYC